MRIAACVMALCLLGPALRAGEEMLAMRGRPPEGSQPVNRVTTEARWSGPVGGDGTEARETVYFAWKDTCRRTRIQLSDRTVEWSGSTDFGMTPRFVARGTESSPGAFLGLLLKEFTQYGDKETGAP